MGANGQLLGAVQQPVMNLAQPLNDVQLVALVAAGLMGTAPTVADAVDSAMEIVALAAARIGEMPGLIRAKHAELSG